jgi:4-hydroxybenzoate polyprenyltransferase
MAISGKTGPLVKLADIFFLTRPPLLAVSSTFFFAGASASLRSVTGAFSISLMQGAYRGLALYLLVVAVSFVVNQIFDVGSDAVNRKNFILPSGAVSRPESVIFLLVLCAAIGLLCRGETGTMVLLALGGLGIGFLYSVPPVRLKGKPVVDLVANAVGFGCVGFLMGWQAFSGLSREALLRSVPYGIAMGAIFLNTCIPDEVGDRAVGDSTSCVVFGKSAVARAALALMGVSVVAAFASGDAICALAALAAIPAFAAVAADPTPVNSVVASQLAARVLFILVCVGAPILAGLGVAAYLASRVYYARRFSIAYPRLDGARLPTGDGRYEDSR